MDDFLAGNTRAPRTLTRNALEDALHWQRGTLKKLLAGQPVAAPAVPSTAQLIDLAKLQPHIRAAVERLVELNDEGDVPRSS